MRQAKNASENLIWFLRGNSKYHYYGIRVKPGSSLTTVEETGVRNAPGSAGGVKTQGTVRSFKRNSDSVDPSVSVGMLTQHLSYLGDGSNAIPNFPDINFATALPDDCGYEDVDTLKYVSMDSWGCGNNCELS